MIYRLLPGLSLQGMQVEEKDSIGRRARPALFGANAIGRQVTEKSANGGRRLKSRAPHGLC
jgi:hypothetical protein